MHMSQENTNPFAGAEIITSADTIKPDIDTKLDPVPFTPPVKAAADGSIPALPKVPSHFIDPSTGSVVEVASKDRTFLRHYLELGQKGAEKFAKISTTRAEHLLKLPAIQAYLRTVLWNAGITDDIIATKIKEGMDAMVAPKEFLNKEGTIVEGKEHIDFEQRGKYIDRALRVQGIDKPEQASPYGPAGGATPHSGLLVGLKPEDVMRLVDYLKADQEKRGATEAVVESPAPPDGARP